MLGLKRSGEEAKGLQGLGREMRDYGEGGDPARLQLEREEMGQKKFGELTVQVIPSLDI